MMLKTNFHQKWIDQVLEMGSSLVEFDKMWFIFQAFQHSLPCSPYTSSIGVAALGFPRGIEVIILILAKVLNCSGWPHPIGPILLPSQFFFPMLGNRKRLDGAKSRELWSTSSKPQSRTATIATTDLCAGQCLHFQGIFLVLAKSKEFWTPQGIFQGIPKV